MNAILAFMLKHPGWHRLSRGTLEYQQAENLAAWGFLQQTAGCAFRAAKFK